MSREDEGADALDLLAEEFVARHRGGERPSITSYAERHPELADDIREIFPLLNAMESLRAESGAAPLPGDGHVGPYEIVREVGRGGMGVVYEAVQQDLGRRVALKILPPQATLDARFLERFRQEAQAAASLHHPQIVPVFGYGRHADLHYYSMEFIDGRGLDAVIRETIDRLEGSPGPASDAGEHFRRTAEIGRLAAGAIAHAHAQGVLHRDVKPGNLLLDENDNLWVADFGLCRLEDSDGLTASGDVLGTFRYLPPERFSGVSDARGDVYGIGITMYELLTRRRAYEGSEPAAIAAQITAGPPVRPRALDPRIPADLETIVRRAMAHDPSQRYPTADALAADLSAYLAGRPIAARAPTVGYLLHRAIQRHKLLTATVLLATLLLVGSSVWYVVQLREKEARARLGHYIANIAAVEAARRSPGAPQALGLLQDAPAEFRNWEWRYLGSRLDPALRSFPSLPVPIHAVAYHPEGTWFAATLRDELWIYDDATGAVVRRLPIDATRCVRWSPAGDRFAVGTAEGLEIWSWPAGKRILRADLEGEVRHLAFTRGGRRIVCGLVEGAIVTYDAQGGGELHREALPSRVLALAYDVASDRVVVGTSDGRVQVFTLDPWTALWQCAVSPTGAASVAFLADGRVGCATREGTVLIWEGATGAAVRSHAVGATATAFVHDPTAARDLVCASGRLYVFDPLRNVRSRILEGRAQPNVGAVHPEGRRIVVASGAGTLEEWYLGGESDPDVLKGHVDDVMTARFDPAGRRVASAGFGGELRIWDVATRELARVLPGHGRAVKRVCFSPDGRWLASGDWAGEILLWNARTLELVRRLPVLDDAVFGLEFLPESRRLVSLDRTGGLCLWDVETGRSACDVEVPGAASEGGVLAVHPEGAWVATGHADGHVRLWRATDLVPARTLRGHVQGVTGLAFSPDGRRLASVSADQTLRIWDPRTGGQIERLAQHDPDLAPEPDALGALAWSPDGTRIATGAVSGALSLWDTESGRLVVRLHPAWSWISEVAFSPDGETLLAPLTNGEVHLLDTRPMRERVEHYEGAAELALSAERVVDALAPRDTDPALLLAALRIDVELSPALREACLRLVHRRSATHDGLIRRAWRDLLSADGTATDRLAAYGLARGLYRASRHREEEDPRVDTLVGLAALRNGNPGVALKVLDRTAPRNRIRDRELYAVDLAVVSLAHLAREEVTDAQGHLDELETLLDAEPGLATERVRALHAQVRAALEALR